MDKKTVLDYSVIRPMDIVFSGAHSVFAAAIRVVTGGGVRHAFDHGLPNHVGVVVEFHGQLLVAEMLSDGLEINSLEAYTQGGRKPFIVSIARHPGWTAEKAAEAQKRIAMNRRKTLEYDWGGDLAFIGLGKNNPNKAYCSEYAAMLLRDYLGVIHPSGSVAVDPAALWIWMKAKGWEYPGWKK
jgi:hypothetical protein